MLISCSRTAVGCETSTSPDCTFANDPAFSSFDTHSVWAAAPMRAVPFCTFVRNLLHRTLMASHALIARSLAEVRLTQGIQNREPFLVAGFIDEIASASTLEANARGVSLTVTPVEDRVAIRADRQVLAAVVGNLLQNAFKFTRPGTTVTLSVGASAERVLIEIQDECSGLPSGDVNELFRPFEQRSADRTGMGLGLAFSRWGAEANDGRIYARNLPGRGCVFTVDLPRVPVPAVAFV